LDRRVHRAPFARSKALNADFPQHAAQADSCVVISAEAGTSVYLFGEKFCLADLRARVLDVQCRISRRLTQISAQSTTMNPHESDLKRSDESTM
jgi:hypothetical protein